MAAPASARIEVLILPVADVDVAKSFYERAGFHLDVDYRPTPDFRVVQFTPPASACSIQLVAADAPTTPHETYLVVEDLVVARAELIERGVEVGEPRHKEPREGWAGGWADGPDPDRADYSTFADFTDPDGHRWLLQERGTPRPSPK
jgi:catechol 2,3-dioxygenase-like lactoylglutathione lyase family enzyme